MKAFSKITSGIALGIILMGILIVPTAAMAEEDYTLLEPSVLPGDQTSTTFENYVEQGFRTFLAVVVIIAIVMLTASGLQYIISGSGGGKGEAKTRALAAILGLLIALSAYLILRTINPDLVDLTLDIANRGGEAGRAGVVAQPPTNPGGGGGNTNPGNNTGGYDHNLGALSGPRQEGETNAEAILRNAQYAANTQVSTCEMPGTDGGNRACAGAVNAIVETATGSPAGGGLSTSAMNTALQEQPARFEAVGTGRAGMLMSQPGDIIISPSSNLGTGHVGICETAGCENIISNQSGNAVVGRGINGNYWRSNYSQLGIYVYRPIG